MTRSQRVLVSTAMVLAFVRVPGAARAWHAADAYLESPNQGGGGAAFFVGSPRQKGYDCTLCHVDADGAISIHLSSDPADLAVGRYLPGTRYRIDLRLIGEHRGGGSLSNPNAFMAEIVTEDRLALGGYQASPDVLRVIDGGRVIGARGVGDATAWSFEWTAPAEDDGPLTLHIGMVDGDGAGDPSASRTDPLGDDVALLALRLCGPELACGPEAVTDAPASGGCDAGGGATGSGLVGLVIALSLVILRRRGANTAAITGALVGLTAWVACFDPSTREECRDRVCEGGSGEGGAGADCSENWVCSPWEAEPGSDEATRTCTDENQAGTTECKPGEGPISLPALDLEYFKCQVMPVFQRGCAGMGCHGTDVGRPFRVYARGRLRNSEIVQRVDSCLETGTVNLQEAGSGTVMCEGWLPHTELEWKKNYDSARSFMVGVENAADSDLLRQPVVGGKPHVGVHLFRDTDPDYLTILDWLEGAELGGPCSTGPN